ncbi:gamma-glutamyltransferase [Aliiglaciecola sp. 3_MG-2023]|uniref:gamma-glutamyltransferase n=1 Tax=Aliiglaciecola sp. 3_MG-2023 TaxID=3062644 RepID=UPI0026E3D5AF|nr:gamma-glutamyltransferase [Aliiglaciecola sp. 3_MG-2023]MDO6692232.1 gamma-glutamyltransferase [Aliiglaciecola sp. 3_MG-2023]
MCIKTIIMSILLTTSFGLIAEPIEQPYNISELGIARYQDVFHPVVGQQGMVSTQNRIATQVGLDILKRGGNAIDASVAVAFALSVTLPRAGNLGGGGFMLFHSADAGENYAIDYRETAPTGVTAKHFLTKEGKKDKSSATSWHAAGVPGTVAGMYKSWQVFGSGLLTWQQLLQPAIELAQQGFIVNYDLAQILDMKKDWLTENSNTAASFYKADGSGYRKGDILKQPDLAWSLRQIATQGADAFYHGEIAKKIVKDMQKHGGHIEKQDLANYQVKIKQPLKGSYHGYHFIGMPPPSSGGATIIEMLNILERFPIKQWGRGSQSLHVMTEAMKLSFADRGTYIADPDFYNVPVNWLIDKERTKGLAAKISMDSSINALQLKGERLVDEGPSTTHFSIVDKHGNAVSNTYTLGYSFGIGKVIEGTGILLNNQIHTFSVRAGIEDVKGFIASKANKLEAGKRPVSSQSPVIVLKDNKPFLVLGSPGGSRIINVVSQMISNVIDHDMNIAEATNQRRIHHQWIPDLLEVEPGFNKDTIKLLQAKGQNVKETYTMGSTQSILIKDGLLFGSSDPRRPNASTRGY